MSESPTTASSYDRAKKRVDDLRGVLAGLKARGVRLIDQEPREGAEGALVAFVHPASTHGVLVELKQRLKD